MTEELFDKEALEKGEELSKEEKEGIVEDATELDSLDNGDMKTAEEI